MTFSSISTKNRFLYCARWLLAISCLGTPVAQAEGLAAGNNTSQPASVPVTDLLALPITPIDDLAIPTSTAKHFSAHLAVPTSTASKFSTVNIAQGLVTEMSKSVPTAS